jgi:hypothetical protein
MKNVRQILYLDDVLQLAPILTLAPRLTQKNKSSRDTPKSSRYLDDALKKSVAVSKLPYTKYHTVELITNDSLKIMETRKSTGRS